MKQDGGSGLLSYLCQLRFLLDKVVGFFDESLQTIFVGLDLRLKRLVTHPLAVNVLGVTVRLVLCCQHLLSKPVTQLGNTQYSTKSHTCTHRQTQITKTVWALGERRNIRI